MPAMKRNRDCPECGGDLLFTGAFFTTRREGRRYCRKPLWCVACDKVWDDWADGEPLTPGTPLSEQRKRQLLET